MTETAPAPPRRRANGEASRRKILDAAAQIAAERGYEGTSISLVSERSGLPASSIYWQFRNKDELIAAVIDRSFQSWVGQLDPGPDAPAVDADSRAETLRAAMARTGRALSNAPDFLRLGIMLVLERRPDEPTARTKFIEIRHATHESTVRLYEALFPELTNDARRRLATFTLAAADGILVAHEIEHIEMPEAFELLAAAILGAAERLAIETTTASG